MSINMHVQSFSVLHRICRCICNEIIILCAFFKHVSWYLAMLKKHKPHRVWSKIISLKSRCIHSPQLTAYMYNVFQTKSLREVSIIWGVQFHKSHRVYIVNCLIFIRKSLSILCIRRNWLHTWITYSKQKLSTLRKLQYHGYGECKFRLFFINFVVYHQYDELSIV